MKTVFFLWVLIAALLLPMERAASTQAVQKAKASSSLFVFSYIHTAFIKPVLKSIKLFQHLLRNKILIELIFYQIMSLALTIALFQSITNQ
ncbi:hypothetical protein [Cellvibrio sp.]|uniref:hypothetical protein n=1 Tax=Cellvibrio sp. TaxID=1965322 RepID=UPI0039647BB7